jgi:hypothetical protein
MTALTLELDQLLMLLPQPVAHEDGEKLHSAGVDIGGLAAHELRSYILTTDMPFACKQSSVT